MSSDFTLPARPTTKISWPKRQVAKLKTKLRHKLGPKSSSNTNNDIHEFLNPPSQTASSTPAPNPVAGKSAADDEREMPGTSEESKTGQSQDVKGSVVEKTAAQDPALQISEKEQVPNADEEPGRPPIPATA
ncbi:hypothetical protein IFR05_008550 [Cadophora sp. M221]|nr:hypothetical protein IFR05_008550 [Cadophora sp. M221]